MLIDKGYNTNWQKAIEHTGFQHDHHVAFSGGNTSNGYRVALGYIDHEGVIVHERMRNFTSNMSMHQSMFDNLLHIDVGMFGNIQKTPPPSTTSRRPSTAPPRGIPPTTRAAMQAAATTASPMPTRSPTRWRSWTAAPATRRPT